MVQTTQKPGIQIMQTPKGLLARGYLPGIDNLDVDIQEDAVIFSGNSMKGEFYEQLELQTPVDADNSITTYHDYQLRMVMPWRVER